MEICYNMNSNMEKLTDTERAFVGIDPGKFGAMVVLLEYGHEGCHIPSYEGHRIPFDETEYRKTLARLDPERTIVVVEHVGAMPGQGSVSTFNFGQNFGFILGLLTAFGLPYVLVRPQKWKKDYSCTSDKNTSIAVAKRLYPWFGLKRTPRCTKDDDGLAEALLLADYGRHHHG